MEVDIEDKIMSNKLNNHLVFLISNTNVNKNREIQVWTQLSMNARNLINVIK